MLTLIALLIGIHNGNAASQIAFLHKFIGFLHQCTPMLRQGLSIDLLKPSGYIFGNHAIRTLQQLIVQLVNQDEIIVNAGQQLMTCLNIGDFFNGLRGALYACQMLKLMLITAIDAAIYLDSAEMQLGKGVRFIAGRRSAQYWAKELMVSLRLKMKARGGKRAAATDCCKLKVNKKLVH